jgi:hypothetical protein
MVKIVTDFRVLLSLAKEASEAKIKNEPDWKEKEKRHEDYRKICLESDEMRIM